MNVPLLGPMTLTGFAHSWWFLFFVVIIGLVTLYILAQLARQRSPTPVAHEPHHIGDPVAIGAQGQ